MAPLRREAKSWALQGAGSGVFTSSSIGSLRLVPRSGAGLPSRRI